jgi:NitT/TauT family transport system permease protein
MNKLLKVITPFKTLTSNERLISTGILLILLLLLWTSSGSRYIPDPLDVIRAFPRLVGSKDLIFNFQKSLFFCLKAIGYSSLIAIFFCYLSVLPLFQTLCVFLRKFRFLPSTGLSFLFMKMTHDIQSQMLWMMVFGVTTWLIDSMVGVALAISPEEIMYAKSLRLNRWQMMREILMFGKAADLFQCIIANFAMAWLLLASVENIAKSSGGIGVVLAESNKYFKFDEVYAIQFIILLTGIGVDFGLNKLRAFFFPYTALKN